MGIQGAFGYIIGKKKRLMHIQYDADLLWQTLVREIYILLKHYETIDNMCAAFENLKIAKNKPKNDIIEKCKYFSDLNYDYSSITNWSCLLRYCQQSFINVLESGYFLNDGEDYGLVFIIDFNKKCVRYYERDRKGNIEELEMANIDDIMNFEEMPIKTKEEIIEELKTHYNEYYINLTKIKKEQDKINSIIERAKQLGGDQNIIDQANKLMDDTKWEETKLYRSYRVFYHRLDALNLIDHTSN
jgi:hypothetical protein